MLFPCILCFLEFLLIWTNDTQCVLCLQVRNLITRQEKPSSFSHESWKFFKKNMFELKTFHQTCESGNWFSLSFSFLSRELHKWTFSFMTRQTTWTWRKHENGVRMLREVWQMRVELLQNWKTDKNVGSKVKSNEVTNWFIDFLVEILLKNVMDDSSSRISFPKGICSSVKGLSILWHASREDIVSSGIGWQLTMNTMTRESKVWKIRRLSSLSFRPIPKKSLSDYASFLLE